MNSFTDGGVTRPRLPVWNRERCVCVGQRGRGLKQTGRVKNRVEGNITELTRCIRRNTTSMEKPSNADLFLFIFFLIWCSSEKINKNPLQVTRFTETVYCRLLDSVVSQVETVTNSMGLGSLFKTSKESVASVPCLHAHLFSSFFMNSIQVLAVLLVPRLRFDVDGSPLFLPLINFITLSPTPLHLTKR